MSHSATSPLLSSTLRLLIAACAVAVASCGGSGGGSTPIDSGAPSSGPTITEQPQSATVSVGQRATFTVTASGSGLKYQWLRDGVEISGATSSTYETSVTNNSDNNAQYSVRIWNSTSSVQSAMATLLISTTTAIQQSPIASGIDYTLARRADGSVIVLGSGMVGGELSAVSGTAAFLIDNLDNIKSVHSNSRHRSLAIDANGLLWAWGVDSSGALSGSIRTSTTIAKPITVPGLTNVAAVVAVKYDGYDPFAPNLYALHTDGTISFSPGIISNRSVSPRKLAGLTNVISIARGEDSGYMDSFESSPYAIKQDGTVWRLAGSKANVGSNYEYSVSTTQITGLPSVSQISCGGDYCLALASDGSIWGWGSNSSGKLGDGTEIGRTIPVRSVSVANVKKVIATEGTSYAISADGLYAWGSMDTDKWNGMFYSHTPIKIVDGGVSDLSYSYDGFTTVLLSSGEIISWGSNSKGQLGDGTTQSTNSKSPVTAVGINLN